jgi:threonine/homoserine/homoserine lactone efflux protein
VAPRRGPAKGGRPRGKAPQPVPDLRAASPELVRLGRQAGLAVAVTGVLWVAATWAGGHWGWPQRWRALLDLFALAGFGYALYLTWRAWRLRRNERD